ncbi:DUF4082 domain-containing protein [Methylovirgula sp. 4M-Z18]|uniref:DUF4082 domain-containing protein n=1 Tax=Methylovirgula sp. 4M-Z18 TaxID=2293567 RepID=UPI000E2F7911|nr:DUF4082 domain-containing protein [Methylovirgula sp. 4M-Z18]RFB76660.1 DUF4082 domain-containing protein [Methylovirgula sp. 4M-Z18]
MADDNTPDNNTLFEAILAMDAYDRDAVTGALARLPGTSTTVSRQLGNATFVKGSDDPDTLFHAIAWNWGGQTVISYRGTTDILSDLFNGYGVGASYPNGPMAQEAIQFYQLVANSNPQFNGDYRTANILLVGHSLGGGLAGFVADIYSQKAVIFDNMAFEAAATTAFTESMPTSSPYGQFPPQNPTLKSLIYGSGTPFPGSISGISAYAVVGEAIEDLRALQTTHVNPIKPYGQASSIPGYNGADLHRMAVLVDLMWAQINNKTAWQSVATPLLGALFNDAVAKDALGSEAVASQLRDEIAYSAVPTGYQPFGTQAIQSMFNDADTLGDLVSTNKLTGVLNGSGIQDALAEILVQYAGEQAITAAKAGGTTDGTAAGDGVLSVDGTTLTVNLGPAKWVSNPQQTSPAIFGRDDFASLLLQSTFVDQGYRDTGYEVFLYEKMAAIVTNYVTQIQAALGPNTNLSSGSPSGAILVGSDGSGTITVGNGSSLIVGGSQVTVGDGNNLIIGESGDETISLGGGNNIVAGGTQGKATVDYTALDAKTGPHQYELSAGSYKLAGDILVTKTRLGAAASSATQDDLTHVSQLTVGTSDAVKLDGPKLQINIQDQALTPGGGTQHGAIDLPSGTGKTYALSGVSRIGASGGNETFNVDYGAGGGSPMLLMADGTGNDFEFKNTAHASTTFVWGGTGNDTFDFDQTANVCELRIAGLTEANLSDLDLTKLANNLESEGFIQQNSTVIINPTNTDKLEYQGEEINSPTYQMLSQDQSSTIYTSNLTGQILSLSSWEWGESFFYGSDKFSYNIGFPRAENATFPSLIINPLGSGQTSSNEQSGKYNTEGDPLQGYTLTRYGFTYDKSAPTDLSGNKIMISGWVPGDFGINPIGNGPAEIGVWTNVGSNGPVSQNVPAYPALPPNYFANSSSIESQLLLNLSDYLLSPQGSSSGSGSGSGSTGGTPPQPSVSVSDFQANQSSLDATSGGFVVSDTAVNVAAAFDALNADQSLAAIALTDPGTPTLALTARQAENDIAAFNLITNSNYILTVVDTSADVSTEFDQLNTDRTVSTITTTDSSTAALTLTATQVEHDTSAFRKITNASYTIDVADTAANVGTLIDNLSGNSNLASVTLTDTGTPTVALAAYQVGDDSDVLQKISNPTYTIDVADYASDVSVYIDALNANTHLAAITLSDTSGRTPMLTDSMGGILTLTSAQATNDILALGKITNTNYVVESGQSAVVYGDGNQLSINAASTSLNLKGGSNVVSVAQGMGATITTPDASFTEAPDGTIKLTGNVDPTSISLTNGVVSLSLDGGNVVNIALANTFLQVQYLDASGVPVWNQFLGSGLQVVAPAQYEVKGSNISLALDNSSFNVESGASLALDGSSDTVKVQSGATLSLTGSADHVTMESGATSLSLSGNGNVVDASATQNAYLTLSGANNSTTVGANSLVYDNGANDTVTVISNLTTVSDNGSNEIINATQGNDTIDINDTGTATASLNNDLVYMTGSANVAGNNNQFTIESKSDVLNLNGNNNIVTVAQKENATIATTQAALVQMPDGSLALSGSTSLSSVLLSDGVATVVLDNGNVVEVSGVSSFTNVEYIDGSGNTTSTELIDSDLQAVGSAQYTVTGLNGSAMVNGMSFDVHSQSKFSVTGSANSVTLESGASSLTVTGDGNGVAAGSDAGVSVTLSGSGNQLTLGANGSLAESGANNTITLGAGAYATVNGATDTVTAAQGGATVYINGSGTSVANLTNDQAYFHGSAQVNGNGNTLSLEANSVGLDVNGSNNSILMEAGLQNLSVVTSDISAAEKADGTIAISGNPASYSMTFSLNASGNGLMAGGTAAIKCADGNIITIDGVTYFTKVEQIDSNGNTTWTTLGFLEVAPNQYNVLEPGISASISNASFDMQSGASMNLTGSSDQVTLEQGSQYLSLTGNGNTVNSNVQSGTVGVTVSGTGNTLNLAGVSSIGEAGQNNTITLGANATGEIGGSNDTIYAMSGGDTLYFDGAGDVANLTSDTAYLYGPSTINGDNNNLTVGENGVALQINGADNNISVNQTLNASITVGSASLTERTDGTITATGLLSPSAVSYANGILSVTLNNGNVVHYSNASQIDLSVASFLNNEAGLDGFPGQVIVSDTAANVAANAAALNADTHISSINVVETVDGVLTNQAGLAQITGPLRVTVNDSASNVAANLPMLAVDPQITTINVSDTAANVSGNWDALSTATKLHSMVLTDSGTSTLVLTASQAATEAGALSLIVGSYNLAVTDSAADVSANFDALNSNSRISAINLTDPGIATLTLSAAQALGDETALSLIANSNANYAIAVSDTASNILADTANLAFDKNVSSVSVSDTAADVSSVFDALDGDTAIASITLTDTSTPTLSLTLAQVEGDVQALQEITNVIYQVNLTDLGSSALVLGKTNGTNDLSGGTVIVEPNVSAVVTGDQNNIVALLGSALNLSGNDNSVIQGDNASLILAGTGNIVTDIGSGGTTTLTDGADALVNGSNLHVTQTTNSAATVLDGSQTLSAAGSGSAVSSSMVDVLGSGNTTIASGVTIKLEAGASDVIVGDGNAINQSADASATLTGNNDLVTLGQNSTLTVNGTNETIADNAGSSTVTLVDGSTATITGMSDTVDLGSNNQVAASGSGLTFNVSGSNDKISVSNATIYVADGQTLEIDGSNDRVVAGNNANVTINGASAVYFTVTENNALTIQASALLSHDSDPSGLPFSITSVSNPVNGTVSYNSQNQTVTFTPNQGYAGAASFTYAFTDSSGASGSDQVSLNVAYPITAQSLFGTNDTPSVVNSGDSGPVELGVKFTASVNGMVTGIRFYKGASNTGTHVADLWSSTGTLLATATFTGESASGWEQVNFSTPVAITAGTTYVAAYRTGGNYSDSPNYFAGALTNGELTATATTNGVYSYGSGANFPTNSYNSTNYWVDVVFDGSIQPIANPDSGFVVNENGSISIAASTLLANDSDTGGQAISLSGVSNPINGTVSYSASNQTVTFVPTTGYDGNASFTYTISDTGGATASTNVSLFVNNPTEETLFGLSSTPSTLTVNDPNSVELGVKFTADADGTITGLRFYKGPGNTGPHVADLWDSNGTLLASANFTNETASGWQQVNFSSPVAITADATYVASYHTSGNYSVTSNYFANPVVSGDLTAPASGNGVYAYGSGSVFPNASYNAGNYWVDVVYAKAPPVANNDSGFATNMNTATTISASALLATDTDPGGLALSVTGVSNPNNGTVSYNATNQTVTFTPSANYTGSASFTYTITDTSGLSASATASLMVSDPATSSLFDPTTAPSLTSVNDPNAAELGVQFQASSNGEITGLRFYKGAQNTGTHVADLWSSSGTLLASATFTNETPTGWQQVNFTTPVAVTAGTTYVASYHTNSGDYSASPNLFATALTNGPLTAPSSSSSGGNGVYAYGSSSLFPANSYNSTSYGVDVVFKPQLAA